MTADELYKLEPIKIKSNDVWDLHKFLHNVDFDRLSEDIPKTDPDKQISIRTYAYECDDGERSWNLFSVWFDGVPFMVCQSAGRGGEDYTQHWTTNQEYRKRAEEFIKTFLEEPTDFPEEEFDESRDIPGLTEFYGKKLEWYYDPKLEPKYKVGDIVWAKIVEPKHHWTQNIKQVTTRVEIIKINKLNPTKTYAGRQMDREWRDGSPVFCEPGEGSRYTYINDGDIVRLYLEGEDVERVEI